MELIANKSFSVKKDAKSLNDLKKKKGLAKKKKSYFYMYFSQENQVRPKKIKKNYDESILMCAHLSSSRTSNFSFVSILIDF
jgi:hypothetical protein